MPAPVSYKGCVTLCRVSAFSVSPSLPAATVLIFTLYSLDVNLSLNTKVSVSSTSCVRGRRRAH